MRWAQGKLGLPYRGAFDVDQKPFHLHNSGDCWISGTLTNVSHTRAPAGVGTLLAVLVGALLWGVYWVPIRVLESQGLPGVWAGFVLTTVAFLATFVLRLVRRSRPISGLQIVAAMLVGVAFGLYGAAISYTDVVRAILLFYLTPIWSMLIECAYLGRRWSWQSTCAILAALLGIFFIFRGELPVEGLGALGDWMAIFAGMAWSFGSALVFARGQVSVVSLSTWSIASAAVVSGLCVALIATPISEIWFASTLDLGRVAITAVGFGTLYVVPVMLLTLWGTSKFSAVTIGFLMTGEIVSGVATSALFLGEPFGAPEVAGTFLIILGASIEILGSRSQIVA